MSDSSKRRVPGGGHGAVLAAIRTLLADGKAYSADELCALGIEHGLLAPATIPNYVRNAIKTLLDRQRDCGEKPQFCCSGRALPAGDAGRRLRRPRRSRTTQSHRPGVDRAAGGERVPPHAVEPDDGPNVGAQFERDAAAAFIRRFNADVGRRRR